MHYAAAFTLSNFMEYPNMALGFAAQRPLECSTTTKISYLHCLMNIWFLFGAVNLIYQNFGMVIYLVLPQHELTADENVSLVAQISETGGIMGLTIVGACKMWMLLKHRKSFMVLLREFQCMLPSVEVQRRTCECVGDIVLELHRMPGVYRIAHYYHKSRFLMKRTTIFFMSAYCYYNALPIIEFLYEHYSDEHVFQYHYQSNTWYPWQMFCDKNSLGSFLAAYICQGQSSLTGVAFIMAGEFMLCFFITQMQLHFDFLANALGALDAGAPIANHQLKQLIAYHNRLLRISKEINRIFNISFLVNFATSTIAICLMGFSMVMISLAHAFKYSVGLMSFLVFTLLICYAGSEYTTASDKLLPAAFYNNWYEGDLTYRKMLLIFMMRSGQSSVLRAYKFTTVSMKTYMAILKFSYQLYTFFRAMI